MNKETLLTSIQQAYSNAIEVDSGRESASGAYFVLVPDFYSGNPVSEKFSPDGVLKVFPDDTVPLLEKQLIETQQALAGNEYSDLFWPYQFVSLDGVEALISPKFESNIASLFDQEFSPQPAIIDLVFQATADTFTKLGKVYQTSPSPAFYQELESTLQFLANQLTSQLPIDSALPAKVRQINPSTITPFIPQYATLSGNDCWLGNLIFNPKDGKVRIFDPFPLLPIPISNKQAYLKYLMQTNTSIPLLRNCFLDWGRVAVSLGRTILRCQNRGWDKTGNYLKTKTIPKFRQKAINEIGETAMLFSEFLNNCCFAVCDCPNCRETGTLKQSLQNTEELADKLLGNFNESRLPTTGYLSTSYINDMGELCFGQ